MAKVEAWEVKPYPGHDYDIGVCRTWDEGVEMATRSIEYWSEEKDDVTVRLRKIQIDKRDLDEILDPCP